MSPRGSRVPDARSTSSALASAGLDSRSGGLLARTSRSRWGLDDPPIRSPRWCGMLVVMATVKRMVMPCWMHGPGLAWTRVWGSVGGGDDDDDESRFTGMVVVGFKRAVW